MRRIAASILLLALLAGPAPADPGIDVTFLDGAMRVTLQGSFAGSSYLVQRAESAAGPFAPVQNAFTLCTGDCFVQDPLARPGRTYFYRFDLYPSAGGFESFGPYPVTIPDTPFAARLWPNPGSGAARVQLSLPGARTDAPLAVDARILDVQGRTVRTLSRGPLARGITSLAWDGRGDAGQRLRGGIYFLRFASPLGVSTTRFVRFE